MLAVGPAFGACAVVLILWDGRDAIAPWVVAGLLTGFACVLKLSYLIAFLPVITVLVLWRAADVATKAHGGRGWVLLSARTAIPLAAGFLVAVAPHLLKNALILKSAFPPGDITPFFGPGTTARILLTYPFALTYGRYWGEVGTLSPLVLAFAPLSLAYRPTALRWKQNRVFAIGAAALAGTVAWMVLCPSVLASRYVLATLPLLAIPAAAAAEIMSRQRTLLSLLVAPAALIVLALGPRHANVDALLYRGFTSGIYRFLGPQEACSGSYPFTSDCVAARAINTEAVPGDRVLLLTYVRLWLRPELIQSASTFADSKRFAACQTATCTPSQFWAFYLAQPNFRFILHDRSSHLLPPETLVSPPKGVTVRLLSSDGGVEAYCVTIEPK